MEDVFVLAAAMVSPPSAELPLPPVPPLPTSKSSVSVVVVVVVGGGAATAVVVTVGVNDEDDIRTSPLSWSLLPVLVAVRLAVDSTPDVVMPGVDDRRSVGA